MNEREATEQIIALEREWCARLKAKDVDWIVELFDTEGVQLPPGSGPVAGREALRAAWHALAHTDGLELEWQPKRVHVAAGGDMAYDMGEGRLRTPDGREQPAKYAVVWVQRDGRWKVAVDIFNASS